MRSTENMAFIEQEQIVEGSPKVYVIANSADDALAAQAKIERKGGMRLTNVMRQSILDKVFAFKFKKSGDKLDAMELRLSHRAMVAAFGASTLDMLAKIGPPYALAAHGGDGTPLIGEALKAWRGKKINWRVGQGLQIPMYVKDPLPNNVGWDVAKYFTVKPGPLADTIIGWEEACQAWLVEKREMQTKVNAVLNSVTTFTSLQKTWPGGERFYKSLPLDFPFRNQVPAVRVEELNDALGI
jgi:hypothetical protein